MKIVVAGGTGFIGEPLVRRLSARGEVAVLSRNPERVRIGRGVAWDPPQLGGWTDEVASADVVVNLAGENIGAGRWTESRKRSLVSSRLDATGALVAAMNTNPTMKRTFLSASAVGYYGDRGDEVLHEEAPQGAGFLASLTERWESAAMAAQPVARVVLMRFGVVLGPGGGALQKMLPPFKLGVGGPIGNGRQWMSWVAREDVLRFIEWAIEHHEARGVYNVTAPQPVTNRDFSKALGKALHRPAFMPVPAFALRMMFGDMADEVLLAGQRVMPSRTEGEGFTFSEPKLEGALASNL